MIAAELKKLLHNRTFCILLAIFLTVGVLRPILSPPQDHSAVYAHYAGQSIQAVLEDIDTQLELLEMYQTIELAAQLPADVAEIFLSGYDLTEEEMEALDPEALLRFTDSVAGEIALLEAVKAQAGRAEGYGAYLESIRTQEQTIRNSILYRGNAYALALARKTAAQYAHLDDLVLPLSDPNGAQAALGTWADDVIACAIACLVAMYAFLQERQEGMTALLFSTKRGRSATYLAKIAVTILFGAAACILLAAVRLMAAGDLGDLSRPVQTVPTFYTSPYALSLGQALVLSLLQRTAATALVGMLMSLLCICLERSLALGAAALIAGVQVLCWQLIGAADLLQPLKYLSLPALFSDETLLGNGVFVKLLGQPVNFLWVWLFLLAVGAPGLVLLGRRLYAHTHRALAIPARRQKMRTKKQLPTLLRLELGKLLFHQKAALLLLLLIALQPRFYDSFHARLTTDELRYLSAVTAVEGPYSPQVHQSLEEELRQLEAAQENAGGLVSDELSQRINAQYRVLGLSDYLAARSEPVCYVYEAGYEAMFGLHTIGPRYQPGLIALALCLMLPGLFTLDKETGMDRLLGTTPGVGALRRTRLGIALGLSAAVFVICWLPEVWFIREAFPLSMWSAPAVSLQRFAALPGWVTLWMAVAALWLGRLGWALGCGMLVCAVSKKVGKYIPSVLLSGIALLALLMIV